MTQTQATDSAATTTKPPHLTVVHPESIRSWAQIPEAILAADIPHGPKSYLLDLVGRMKFGVATNGWNEERWDGNKSLAKGIRRSVRTVQRYRAYLKREQWIICTPRYQSKGGQLTNLIKLNVEKLVSNKSAYSRRQSCHPAPDTNGTAAVTETSSKLNPSSPTKPPPYKTTGADGAEWSQLEKEVCERFRAVAPPRVKFNVEKFREMQSKSEMTSSKLQAKLAELAACPFLAAECRSIAIIYHLIDKNSNAYREARNSIARLRLSIRKARTQGEVNEALDEVAKKCGWARKYVVHYIRTRLGFDVKPGAPRVTKRGWLDINQPPNPFAKDVRPANCFGDLLGDEHLYDTPKTSQALGDTTEEVPALPAEAASEPTAEVDKPNGPALAAPQTPQGEESQDPTHQEAQTKPLPSTNEDHVSNAPSEADTSHESPTPPPELERPKNAAEVLFRAGKIKSADGIDLLDVLLAANPPDSEAVIKGLLSAEKRDLAEAA